MARHRPRHSTHRAWFVSWILTTGSLVALLLLPASVWDAIWPDGDLGQRPELDLGRHVFEVVEVVVIPPLPVLETVPDTPDLELENPSLQPVAAWWNQAWEVRVDADLGRTMVLPDSLVPVPLVDIWGAQATVDLIMATPDSVVNARLWQLVTEEELGRNDVSGLYSAVAKARAYVDMKRREAAMFGEFGGDQIRVPD